MHASCIAFVRACRQYMLLVLLSGRFGLGSMNTRSLPSDTSEAVHTTTDDDPRKHNRHELLPPSDLE